MKLLSWNLAGRLARLPEQAAAVAEVDPDVLALQEVSPSTRALWHAACERMGYARVFDSHDVLADLAPVRPAGRVRRTLGILIATRGPAPRLPWPDAIPWPERVLGVRTAGLEIWCAHSPISAQPGFVKLDFHRTLAAHLRARAGGGPCVLAGDLNTPRRVNPDGSIWTFARDAKGHLRPDRGEAWDAAELALVQGLGWSSACPPERTWRGPSGRGGYPLDWILCSPGVSATGCEIRHDWCDAGLSDHAALIAEVRAH